MRRFCKKTSILILFHRRLIDLTVKDYNDVFASWRSFVLGVLQTANLKKSWLQSGQAEALNSNVGPFETEGRQGARARPPVLVQNSDLSPAGLATSRNYIQLYNDVI